jgi:diacylglycerol kinase (ATP)
MVFRTIWNAFHNSLRGIQQTWTHEKAFRYEIIGCVPVLLLTAVWDGAWLNKILVFFSLGIVLIVELLNTAIEKVNDLVKRTHDPLIQFSKDAASAAVFISLVLVALALFNLMLS